MLQPSPDWNTVICRWMGNHLDGSAALGNLKVVYNGAGPLLDPDPTNPMSVFVNPLIVPITTTTLLIDGETREVGFCQFELPASNDPDIVGGGGSYSFTEDLKKGGGRKDVPFIADKDAPDGVIYLNTLAGGTPTPGEPLSVVTVQEFNELTERVNLLEDNPGAELTSYTAQVEALDDYPAAFPPGPHAHPASQISDATTVGRDVLTASSATAARTAIGAGTSNLQLGVGPTTAKAGDYTPTYDEITGKPPVFPPAPHTHDIDDVDGLQTALDGKMAAGAAVTYGQLPAGSTVTVSASLASRPTSDTDVVVQAVGPTEPAWLINGDFWLETPA
ncbi:hypothetical protein DT076_16520 [Desertihabitans brevis]|uniref:Minor tail protein n=2 Tax=Desertihabitans brevis TaxID=2268447 RepID=A0A367YQU0_9ACTN|nr:hypothetical protein DT076_16520 [Desertihabitans brevis]